MAYWILKTEPSNYSFTELLRDKKTIWDGVRNYQARNNLRSMKKGDECMIYHSVGPREIVGVAKVIRAAFVDPTENDERWLAVEIAPVSSFSRAVTLEMMKQEAALKELSLIKQSRLSVCPVSAKEWQRICDLSK